MISLFNILCLGRDKRPIKSLVVGRPILLALEDIDGGPSFLEKALRFLEKHGILSDCIKSICLYVHVLRGTSLPQCGNLYSMNLMLQEPK